MFFVLCHLKETDNFNQFQQHHALYQAVTDDGAVLSKVTELFKHIIN